MSKEEMTIAEISAKTGVSEKYLRDAERAGFVNWKQVASEQQVPAGGQYKEMLEARENGTKVDTKRRTQTAEESLHIFWNGPGGKTRLTHPSMRRDIQNANEGLPVGFTGEYSKINADAIHRENEEMINAEEKRGRGRPRKE